MLSSGTLARSGVLLVIVYVLILNGASHYFEKSDPILALRLNPFNMDARVATFIDLLDDGEPADELTRGIASDALRYSPADSRAYSMMGEITRRDGDDVGASNWFDQALKHSKTEIRALFYKIQEALVAGDVTEAIRHFDIALRRWPGQWETLRVVVPAFISTEDNAELLKGALAYDPPWRSRVIQALLSTAEGVRFVEELLIDALASDEGASRGEVRETIAAMVRRKEPRRAYQFFLATLSPTEKDRFGYVFNPEFLPAAEPGFFDWRIKQASGAETTSGEGLRVRFNDTPTRLGNVTQVLSLPAGSFSLTVVTSATQLTTPKELFWQLNCGRDVLARLIVPEGSYSAEALTAEFSVPFDDCPLQSLTLGTGLSVDSWRYRFRGEARFENVTIRKLN